MITTIISAATAPLAMPYQIAGMHFGLQANCKDASGPAVAYRVEPSLCGEGFSTSPIWGPGIKNITWQR